MGRQTDFCTFSNDTFETSVCLLQFAYRIVPGAKIGQHCLHSEWTSRLLGQFACRVGMFLSFFVFGLNRMNTKLDIFNRYAH